MTTNAIAYQKYVEDRRHNLEMEALQGTSNYIGQQQATAALKNAETNAVNAVSNRINAESSRIGAEASRTQAEASRTQAASSWRQSSAALQQAYNTANYNAGWLAETERHNKVQERNETVKTTMSTITGIFETMNKVAGWYGL